MFDDKFAESDKEKLVEFLNFVAKKAKYEMNTQEVIQYFKLLNFMQTTILKKIDANILEVKSVKSNLPAIPSEE